MAERTEAPEAVASAAPARKPSLSIFLATACGLGYLPKAPGTWGSLGGLLLAVACYAASVINPTDRNGLLFSPGYDFGVGRESYISYLLLGVVATLVVGFVGVAVAGRAARFWGADDPQKVVIDEVSGQHLALLIGCALPGSHMVSTAYSHSVWGLLRRDSVLNWKYLLLGFILFRLFDIWKPFPARQAERLPGGWGIMADDWMAGVYGGLALWIARAFGL